MARYLNGATIMTTPTPESLEVARAAGFDGIEARAERLLEDADELRATAAAVRPGEVWSLNGVRISLRPDGSLDRGQLEADLEPRLEACRLIGAQALLAVPLRAAGLSEGAALTGVREGLDVARERAGAIDVVVAFEFLGFFDCPIRSPEAAGRVVEGLEGVRLVLDSCHWHASGSGPLDSFPVERLAMVHLNDAPQKPPPEVEDADRVLPGLGVIRLPWLIGSLRGRGYPGPWSLETFNPAYWAEDPGLVARRGAAALDAMLGPEA
jgi:2-keto-myo-inositol isomerase